MSIEIIVGDALEQLRLLPSESVHCVVTSPPYYGLRDYKTEPRVWGGDPNCAHRWGLECRSGARQRNGAVNGLHDGRDSNKLADNIVLHPSTGAFCQACNAWCGSLGLEPTPELYVANLVAVFREVRRVLRDDGTLWLVIGDSYNAAGRIGHGTRIGFKQGTNRASAAGVDNPRATASDLKPKDLIGIPWMLAFALRADGWYLRQDIIWSKPNPMPESVEDRCTKAHEYVFLLSKIARYYFDADAITENIKGEPDRRLRSSTFKKVQKIGHAISSAEYVETIGRNRRSVWTIASEPYPEAHFATYPPALIEPCIKAGTSEKGVCAACGAPWVRVVDRVGEWRAQHDRPAKHNGEVYRTNLGGGIAGVNVERRTVDLGWQPSCDCDAAIVPATVLDPFGGAGTTAMVADRLGRDSIIIELNPEYAELSRRRIESDAGMFAEIVTPRRMPDLADCEAQDQLRLINSP